MVGVRTEVGMKLRERSSPKPLAPGISFHTASLLETYFGRSIIRSWMQSGIRVAGSLWGFWFWVSAPSGPALVCTSDTVGTQVGGRALELSGLRGPLACQGVLLASWVKSFAESTLGFSIILSSSKVSGEMGSLGSKDRPC